MHHRMRALEVASGGTPSREICRHRGRYGDHDLPHPHGRFSPRTGLVARCRGLLCPDQLDSEPVRLGDYGHGHALVIGRTSVCPVCSHGVAVDFERLDQARRRPSSFHQFLDLGARHCVAFDGGRVVNVVDPDLAQDRVGLDRSRKAAHARLEEGDFLIETCEDLPERRPAPRAPLGFTNTPRHLNTTLAKPLIAVEPGGGWELPGRFSDEERPGFAGALRESGGLGAISGPPCRLGGPSRGPPCGQCPPNLRRIACRVLQANASSPREVKRW